MPPSLRRFLAARRLPFVAALLGALLVSPSLFGGLATEDHVERTLIVSGQAALPGHLNLFGHDRAWTAADTVRRDTIYRLRGFLPWVTDVRFDASFFRPIASLTHHLDYRAFPRRPWVMHAESILWYAGAILAVGALHRRLLGPGWVSGLATLLYAVDDAHGHPVGWLINRNAVMATLFSVLALVSYDVFRREGRLRFALAAGALLLLALGSAELALSIAGYFVAYELFVAETLPGRRRWIPALGWLVPIALWAVLYRYLGHAVRGSGLYVDPWVDPVTYGTNVLERGALLVMGMFFGPFADAWVRGTPYAQGLLVFWGTVVALTVGRVLLPLVVADRRARFWGMGMLLSLLPATATFPEDRLLLLAGVGAFPLVALAIDAAVEQPSWPGARARSLTAFAAASVGVHALAAPVLLPFRSLSMRAFDRRIRAAGDSAFAQLSGAPNEALLLVNAESYYVPGMAAALREAEGRPLPRRLLTLAGSLDRTVVRRLDAHRLAVSSRDGFLSRAFDRIYRSPAAPFARGEHVDLLGVDVTVTEVSATGEPLAATFAFTLPLEDPRYRWAEWKNGRYERFVPPEVGHMTVVGGS